MTTVNVVVLLSWLFCSALSAPVKGKEDVQQTMFSGEDFHLLLPSPGAEVLFRPLNARAGFERVLMRGGNVINPRAKLNSQLSHLIIANVGEDEEGTYTVKNVDQPEEVKRITLIVRDCSMEQGVMYGQSFHIQLTGVEGPIILEYRSSAVEANQTSSPAQVLLNQAGSPKEGYLGRLSVSDDYVTLNAVTGADEGSYTVKDGTKKIKKKVCLNVRAHPKFEKLPYGGTLKINLILNASSVQLSYAPDYDKKPRQILERGQLMVPEDLDFEERISLDSSFVILEQITTRDSGHFQLTDTRGFPMSTIYLEVSAYRLSTLYVTITALVGLLVFLLLVCLLSCLFKQRKRAAKARAIEKIAQSKEDEGDAFRQVVKNITQFEESMAQSTDITEKSQSTEVDIKGLEVSSKEVAGGNLETSDSGVEFNTTGLPLDTDTDVPDQIPESEAEAESVTVAPETKPSPPTVTKPNLASDIKNISEPTLDSKLTINKPVETKLSPGPTSKLAPSPDAKTPEPARTPELKTPEPKTPELKTPEAAKTPSAVSPSPASLKPTPPLTPVSKPTAPPAPEPTKPVTSMQPLAQTPQLTSEPTTNGTPEPPVPEPTPNMVPVGLIDSPVAKATPPKSPDVELTSSSSPAIKDTPAEDTTTT